MVSKEDFDDFRRRYFAVALDPIHAGAGGQRLGRVDNPIAREPTTGIPKIPGSGVEGPVRAWTALAVDKYPECAGKGGTQGESHCCRPDCPVCVTFGFSNGKTNRSFQGLAKFYDMQIVLFPVPSRAGPVWVTTERTLRSWMRPVVAASRDMKEVASTPGEKAEAIPQWKDKRKVLLPENSEVTAGPLNLGWLLLKAEAAADALPWILPDDPELAWIKPRVVVVDESLFRPLVNANLEVRTSVSIDPNTGAADDGALFTYEAIPRGTVLGFDVIVSPPEKFRVPVKDGLLPIVKPAGTGAGGASGADTAGPEDATAGTADVKWIHETVRKGLDLLELLGLGGMNTRGMGRMRVFGDCQRTGGKGKGA